MSVPVGKGVVAASAWRGVACLATAFLVAAPAAGGMYGTSIFPAALLAGAVAGMLASAPVPAALQAAAAFALAHLAVGPTVSEVNAGITPSRHAADVFLWGLAAAAIAAGVRVLVSRRVLTLRVAAAAITALVIAGMWIATFAEASRPYGISGFPQSSFQQLNGQVPEAGWPSDQNLFIQTILSMRAGGAYHGSYVAWSEKLEIARKAELARQGRASKPTRFAVWNVRLPTAFAIFAALGSAELVTALLLVLATALIVGSALLGQRSLHPALTLPAAAVVASYTACVPVRIDLFGLDVWAGLLLAGAFLAEVGSRVGPDGAWRRLVLAEVALAAAAICVRELALIVALPLAAATAWAPREQRRTRLMAWAAAFGVFAAVYAYHWIRVSGLALGASWGGRTLGGELIGGDLSRVVNALRYGADYLGRSSVVALLVSSLGIAGLLAMPGKGSRLTGAMCILVPLVAFALVSDNAVYRGEGTSYNYWGSLVLPMLFVSVPFALGAIPGASIRPRAPSVVPAEGPAAVVSAAIADGGSRPSERLADVQGTGS